MRASVSQSSGLLAQVKRPSRLDRRLFLAEATAALAEPLGRDRLLERLAELAVPSLGELAAVVTTRPIGLPRLVALAHRNPERARALEAALQRELTSGGAIGARLCRSVRPASTGTQAGASLAAPVTLPGVGGAYVVPVGTSTRPLGALILAGSGARRPAADQISVAEELVRRARRPLENAVLYERAREAMSQNERLLATLSHDLRNPLGVIVASTAVSLKSLETLPSAERLRRQLEAIQRNAERMNGLIHSMSELVAIREDVILAGRRRHPVAALLERITDGLAASAEANRQRLRNGPHVAGTVLCHRDWLLRALASIIGQVIELTREEGTIDVESEALDGWVRITVSGDGPGLPADGIPGLPGVVTGDLTANAGLSMSIARRIVEAHGGELWLESDPRSGVAVRLTLPDADASR